MTELGGDMVGSRLNLKLELTVNKVRAVEMSARLVPFYQNLASFTIVDPG